MDTATPDWTPALPLADLPPGAARVVKAKGQQVALFHLEGGDLYAVDNRCPHEGYPLAEGYVKGCLLTCAWHNFKFDLRDGACVMGDEAVRTFPVRVVDGGIEIDLTAPDPAAAIPKLMASLDAGLREYGLGRVARDLARLLQAGVAPQLLAAEAAAHDARRAEWGSTHALPVATDVLRLLPRYPGLSATLPLMQAFDLAARDSVRLPDRPMPEAVDPGPDPVAAGARLRELAEAEQGDDAQALLRGALAAGWGRAEVEPWFFRLAADHFLDFGHRLIYAVKVMDLLDATGWERAHPILTTYLYGIVNGTREDTLPRWAAWQGRRLALRPSLSALHARRGGEVFSPDARGAFLAAVLDGRGPASFDAVVSAVEAGIAYEAVAEALVIAASHRLLRFDPRYDADPTYQHGWLDVTHVLTFADALTHAVRRWDDPGIIELLLQGARFVNHTRALDLPAEGRFDLAPAPHPPEGLVAALLDALDQRQTQRALALTAAWHEGGGEVAPLRAALEDRALRHPAVQPIFVAHHLKTTVAAFDRYEALGGADRALPLLALVRFLAAEVRERAMERIVHEAVDFVDQGRTPRTLF